MTNSTLPTANEAWGFYGATGAFADADAAWAIAFPAVLAATEGTAEGVRDFLDSRHGRHFADDVANELATGKVVADAIEAATARWMGWRISARTAHETGIPRGLPYLTGYVLHAEIEAETAE